MLIMCEQLDDSEKNWKVTVSQLLKYSDRLCNLNTLFNYKDFFGKEIITLRLN